MNAVSPQTFSDGLVNFYHTSYDALSTQAQRIYVHLQPVGNTLCTDCLILFGPIGRALQAIVHKVFIFIKNNWRQLLAYVFAWGIVVSCTGLMYGFQAVAMPLSIGLACGFGFGIITGILCVKVFDPEARYTLWGMLNKAIEKLDPNGTRQIVLAVAVTVLLAASVVFPYVLGAVIGIIIGNQLAAKIASGRNLGRDPAEIEHERAALLEAQTELQERVKEINEQMKLLNLRWQNMETTIDVDS